MVFGLTPKARYVCIDVQFNEVYFTVIRKVGAFFEIDFTEKLILPEGVFENLQIRTPGKIVDVLHIIKDRFGNIPVIITVPEKFSYTVLLPDSAYSSVGEVKKFIKTLPLTPAYFWSDLFRKNKKSYTSLHAADKKVCDTLYSLVKNAGLQQVALYPRILVFPEIVKTQESIVCDFTNDQISIFSISQGHTTAFSIVSYGKNELIKKIEKKFKLSYQEIEEVLGAYGTDIFPRKEGHVVHGLIHTFLVPIIDEIQSLQLRRVEQGFEPVKQIIITGNLAQYSGVVEDVTRMTKNESRTINVWEGLVNFENYIPHIHKKDSYGFAGVASLMHILKTGTVYEPFDL